MIILIVIVIVIANCNDDSSINVEDYDIESIEQALLHPTDEILFDVVRALNVGMSVDRVNSLSSIDPWFLNKIQTIIRTEKKLRTSTLDKNISAGSEENGILRRPNCQLL